MGASPCGFKSHLRHTLMPKQKLPEKGFTWTPQLAYVVGLLATDGNLSRDRRHITMRSAETELLKIFASCLGLKNKIGFTKGQRGYRIQFSNVQLYNWLMRIGLFPAKTYSLGEIKIPDESFRDFLRGHLDGDGNIRFYEDRYNFYKGRGYTANRLFVRFVSASKSHVIWLRGKISKLAGVHGALIEEKPRDIKRVSIWEVKFSKKESVRLLQWIYYNPALPALERKRSLAENALETIAHETRRKYSKIATPV